MRILYGNNAPVTRLASAVVALTIGHVAGAAAQPPVTFRSGVDYVEVDVRVVDSQGVAVGDLARADFEIREDGRPQQISFLSFVELPRGGADVAANDQTVEPDVRSNVTVGMGRVFLIVLDDLHTSAPMAVRTRTGATHFVEQYMAAHDVAAVMFTSGRTDAAQEFTSSRRRLVAAIQRFSGDKLQSAVLTRLENPKRPRAQGDVTLDPDDAQRVSRARNTLDALRKAASLLEHIRGRRKAMLYFSEGIEYHISQVFANPAAATVIEETRAAIAAATRANVAIYGIDVRGLGAGSELSIWLRAPPDDPQLKLDPLSIVDETRRAQDSLVRDIAFLATNPDGKVFPGNRHTANLEVTKEVAERIRSNGFRVISSMQLPPGRYQLRLAARESHGRRTGSVLYDLDVPAYACDEPMLSDVAVISIAAARTPTARPADPLSPKLPAPMSTARAFAHDDELSIYAELYSSASGPAIDVDVIVAAGDGRTPFVSRNRVDPTAFAGGSAYEVSRHIPLRNLPPGQYVLRITAQWSAETGPATTARSIPFRIVPPR
jgi:VWFA-related protein